MNYLAQQPLNDYQPMHPEFPNEDIMALFGEKVEDEERDNWIVWFDGASNTQGHRVGAALFSPNNQCIPFIARLGFDCTNNMAELRHAPSESKWQLTLTSNCSKCTETQPW